MRYEGQPDIPFTLGLRTVMIKEHLPLSSPIMTANVTKVDAQSSLDEIASRVSVYGENMEAMTYQIFDENVREIFEAGFDLGRINQIRIP